MPKYRLHSDCFFHGARQRSGSVVEFDGPPGSEMEPLCEDGWKAHRAYADERKRKGLPPVTRFPFAVIEARATGGKVREQKLAPIPEDWRDLKGLPLTNLAVQLGAARGIKSSQAAEYIEGEEARRAIAQFSDDTSEQG